jgi:hypothetical protein
VPVDRNFPTSQFSDIDPGTRNVSRPIEHFVCRHNNSDKGKLEAYSEENIPTAFRSVGPYLYLEYLAFPDFLSTDRMKISGGPLDPMKNSGTHLSDIPQFLPAITDIL